MTQPPGKGAAKQQDADNKYKLRVCRMKQATDSYTNNGAAQQCKVALRHGSNIHSNYHVNTALTLTENEL